MSCHRIASFRVVLFVLAFAVLGGSAVTAENPIISVAIDRLYHNEDGTLKRVIMTSEGIQ